MSLLQTTASRTQARQEQLAADAANPNSASPEELQRRYREASRLSTGRVFREGDGILGEEVLKEVQRRKAVRAQLEADKVSKKASKLRQLATNYRDVKRRMSKLGNKYKYTVGI